MCGVRQGASKRNSNYWKILTDEWQSVGRNQVPMTRFVVPIPLGESLVKLLLGAV